MPLGHTAVQRTDHLYSHLTYKPISQVEQQAYSKVGVGCMSLVAGAQHFWQVEGVKKEIPRRKHTNSNCVCNPDQLNLLIPTFAQGMDDSRVPGGKAQGYQVPGTTNEAKDMLLWKPEQQLGSFVPRCAEESKCI